MEESNNGSSAFVPAVDSPPLPSDMQATPVPAGFARPIQLAVARGRVCGRLAIKYWLRALLRHSTMGRRGVGCRPQIALQGSSRLLPGGYVNLERADGTTRLNFRARRTEPSGHLSIGRPCSMAATKTPGLPSEARRRKGEEGGAVVRRWALDVPCWILSVRSGADRMSNPQQCPTPDSGSPRLARTLRRGADPAYGKRGALL
jgi:hypothetical protein